MFEPADARTGERLRDWTIVESDDCGIGLHCESQSNEVLPHQGELAGSAARVHRPPMQATEYTGGSPADPRNTICVVCRKPIDTAFDSPVYDADGFVRHSTCHVKAEGHKRRYWVE